eukprot:c5725_g1_i1.p2 GENE.c5725_g1_i1~~c5725_g1_i1.p2  ORF type:complete len:106 (+),score=17.47 c5725_g1_i1:30-320(+)
MPLCDPYPPYPQPPNTHIQDALNILEVCDFPDKIPNYELDMKLEDVKKSGAYVNYLNNGVVLAIFASPLAAQEALNSHRSRHFSLRPWRPPGFNLF